MKLIIARLYLYVKISKKRLRNSMDRNQLFPLISVIIPTFNRPKMLVRAIKSVNGQTYPNLEIIIVDDGSTSDIKSFIEKECNIIDLQVLRNTRRPGGAGSRNTGFYASKGEYIAFLDDDDEWLPQKISRQFDVFQKSTQKVGIICTHDIRIYRDTKIVHYRYLEGNMYKALCRKHIAGNTSNPLIKRSVLEKVGLFDEDMPAAQDTELWLRIAKQFDFATVNEPLVLVYTHDSEQITKNLRKRRLGYYILLRKHWKDLHILRKYEILKGILRMSVLLAGEKIRQS